jgi:general secretion pathway protein A
MGWGDSTNRMQLGIQRLRRSLRKTASFPVWLRNEKLGPMWEEETETQNVSRYGAGLRCRHFVQAENLLVVVRRDNGRRASARVRYSRSSPDGERQLGIEFIDNDNFWGLDWDSSESETPRLTPMNASVRRRAEPWVGPAANSNPVQPGSSPPAPVRIEKAVEGAVIAPVFAADHSTSGTGPPPVPPKTEGVKLAPTSIPDDSDAEIDATPVQREAESGEIAPSPAIDASATDASARADQEIAVVPIAPPHVTDERAAEISANLFQAVAESVKLVASSIIDASAADASARAEEEMTVVPIAPPPVTDERAPQISANPFQAVAESVKLVPSSITDASAADASARAGQEITVVPVAPPPVTDDSAAESSAIPIQAEAGSAEIAPHPVIDESAAAPTFPSIQRAVKVVRIAPRLVTEDSPADASARANQEIAAVPIAPPPVAEEIAPAANAPPAQAEVESIEIAPIPILEESTVDTGAPQIQDAVEVVVVAPTPATDAAGTSTSAGQGVTEVAQVAPPPVLDESVADTSAPPPSQAEAEGVGTVPSPTLEESTADASAPEIQRPIKVVVLGPTPATDDGAADSGPPPLQPEPESVKIPHGLFLDESTSNFSALPVQETAEEEAPQTLLLANHREDRVAPSFLSFYGLSEQPFDVTPDPEYLYLSPTHREALALLAHGIHNLRGFMALISPPGLGKTTLLNKLMDDLRDSARVVFLFQTQCNSRELLRYLLAELGVEEAGKDAVGMHKALNEILFHEMLKGRRFVLIVDEAQNLQDSVLETVRLLSDFETTHSKLIQIVLCGQPQLAETLKRPNLAQLRQRIAVLANLKPLSVAETAQYIEHRLRKAGLGGRLIFTPDAMTLIGERSKGIPRIINNFCFNALLLGYAEGSNPIDYEIAQKTVTKSDWESLVRQLPPGSSRP